MEYDQDRKKVFELVKSAFHNVDSSVPIERIHPESKIRELFDSLSLVELPLEIENKVRLEYKNKNFSIPEKAIVGIVTVDDIVEALYNELYKDKRSA